MCSVNQILNDIHIALKDFNIINWRHVWGEIFLGGWCWWWLWGDPAWPGEVFTARRSAHDWAVRSCCGGETLWRCDRGALQGRDDRPDCTAARTGWTGHGAYLYITYTTPPPTPTTAKTTSDICCLSSRLFHFPSKDFDITNVVTLHLHLNCIL